MVVSIDRCNNLIFEIQTAYLFFECSKAERPTLLNLRSGLRGPGGHLLARWFRLCLTQCGLHLEQLSVLFYQNYLSGFTKGIQALEENIVDDLDDISALKSGQASSLSIGIFPTWVIENVLPGVISWLHSAYPDLRLTIYRRVNSKELLGSLRAGELDIIVGTEQVAVEQMVLNARI